MDESNFSCMVSASRISRCAYAVCVNSATNSPPVFAAHERDVGARIILERVAHPRLFAANRARARAYKAELLRIEREDAVVLPPLSISKYEGLGVVLLVHIG